ncbi:MAG: hypothetical protein AAF386_14440, partial [Pseudomonadota bacterium]
RHVLGSFAAAGAAALCPAAAFAAVDWKAPQVGDSMPVGEDQLLDIAEGATSVDISALMPGEVAVMKRPNADAAYLNTGGVQHIALHRRTPAQMTDAGDGAEYYVFNMVCPHRGFAISLTTDPARPFACNKQGGRHGSVFNAAGMGIEGASLGDPLTVPGHQIAVSGDTVTLTLA